MEIIGNEHVKRALEVAIKGGHSILLVGNPRSTVYDGSVLPFNVSFVKPCPCGNLHDPVLECVCTIDEVNAYRRTEPNWLAHFDITVELVRPRFDSLISAELFSEIDEGSTHLLKMAYDKLGLTVQDVADVLVVAKTIMRMEQSTEPLQRSQHIAEAIQYKAYTKAYTKAYKGL